MEEMTYEEIRSEIENKRRFGTLSGVEITKRMLSQLQHPQTGLHVIHIAGTNGKGSVSAFLCSILQEAGLKTGMFTSPHLVDFRERIRVNGELISKEDVRRIGGRLLKQDFGVFPTMFDYCLVMAVLYFKEKKCDVVIMETGLGGRLDSTNALFVPEVSVITKIGYDHVAFLGNTLEKIAAEKAGIIKKGTSLVMESQESGALKVLLQAAERAGVERCQVIDHSEIQMEGISDGMQMFSYREYKSIKMRMLGIHQFENAAAAILAAEEYGKIVRAEGLTGETLKKSVREGILKTVWQGRMEVLRNNPFLMVDGAHNSSGVRALKNSLCYLYPGEKFHFIMGVMADKDYREMVKELLPLALDFTTVTVENGRALQAEQLAECICEMGVKARHCQETLACLLPENSDSDRKTVAFGSLYFIGEIESICYDKKLQKRYNFLGV